MSDPHASQVRISLAGSPGLTVGCGLLVTPRHVVTCAHVVAEALADPALALASAAPAGAVPLDLPLLAVPFRTSGRVVCWHPARDDGTKVPEDIAVLELADEAPAAAAPAALLALDPEDYTQRPVHCFGFPAAIDDDRVERERLVTLIGPSGGGKSSLIGAGLLPVLADRGGWLDTDDLKAAIQGPAAACGVRFGPGLVDAMVADLEDQPGRLPLLQFALTQLWDQQQARCIDAAALERLGGVRRALSAYADGVIDALSEADRTRARRILIQLVRPAERAAEVGTRQVASLRRIADQDQDLLPRLAASRLVVTSGGTDDEPLAEIAHEALIREWDRLRTWVGEDRVFRLWQEGLRSRLLVDVDAPGAAGRITILGCFPRSRPRRHTMCWARYLFAGVVIGLGTLSMISACGQKGPLYLAEKTPESAAATPSAPATQAVPAPGADVPKPVDRAADAPGPAWPR